jgi:hypothetical protein
MRDMRYAIPETSDRISYPPSPISHLVSRIPHVSRIPYPPSPISHLASRIPYLACLPYLISRLP